jgi:hypothetical protein
MFSYESSVSGLVSLWLLCQTRHLNTLLGFEEIMPVYPHCFVVKVIAFYITAP